MTQDVALIAMIVLGFRERAQTGTTLKPASGSIGSIRRHHSTRRHTHYILTHRGIGHLVGFRLDEAIRSGWLRDPSMDLHSVHVHVGVHMCEAEAEAEDKHVSIPAPHSLSFRERRPEGAQQKATSSRTG